MNGGGLKNLYSEMRKKHFPLGYLHAFHAGGCKLVGKKKAKSEKRCMLEVRSKTAWKTIGLGGGWRINSNTWGELHKMRK